MTVVAPIPAARRPRGAARHARLAAIAFALVVHALAILTLVLTGVALEPPVASAPVSLDMRAPPPPPPSPVAPKRRAGGSPATAPKRATPSSPRPQPARLAPVHIRPPAPVPILPVPTPTLAAPKGPDMASPVTGAGVSVGTGGQGVGEGNGPGGAGGSLFSPVWVDGPTQGQINKAYPRAALRAGLSGDVELGCRELVDGRVDHCVVLEESPKDEGFGRAALALSRTFRFHPYTEGGTPRETLVRIPYGLGLFPEERLRGDPE